MTKNLYVKISKYITNENISCKSLECYSVINSISISFVEKCPALNLSRHLKVSPNSCVTSPMKINAKCSFSCPPGYQLQGPLYKQCRSRGQWTNNDKPVSCIGGFIVIMYVLKNLLYTFTVSPPINSFPSCKSHKLSLKLEYKKTVSPRGIQREIRKWKR